MMKRLMAVTIIPVIAAFLSSGCRFDVDTESLGDRG
jgi:hypothetical protein